MLTTVFGAIFVRPGFTLAFTMRPLIVAITVTGSVTRTVSGLSDAMPIDRGHAVDDERQRLRQPGDGERRRVGAVRHLHAARREPGEREALRSDRELCRQEREAEQRRRERERDVARLRERELEDGLVVATVGVRRDERSSRRVNESTLWLIVTGTVACAVRPSKSRAVSRIV